MKVFYSYVLVLEMMNISRYLKDSSPAAAFSDSEVACSLPEDSARALSPVAKKSNIHAWEADAPPQASMEALRFSSENSSMKNGTKSGCEKSR